jgi:superfamily II DNA or RNA helicase
VTLSLRPYQLAAIERVRSHLRTHRRVLLAAPTGAGKTVIASAIIASAHSKGSHVVFFAHRRELIHQTRRKLIDAGIPGESIGVLMADDPFTDLTAPIQIASIDTFRHREPPLASLVIIDEAHRSLANTYLEAIKHYSDAGAVVIGMTATPYRADGGGLGDIYEALEVVASPAQLIAEGFLTAPRVFSVPVGSGPDLSGVRTRGGDYVTEDLTEAMNSQRLVGDIVDHWQRLAEGRRTVVFATGVEHSRAITEAFLAAGVAAEHLDGETPTRDRDAILRRIEVGETLVVSNCGVLCEGWDQPAVKCCILARPTKSTGLYLQQAGRILRPWEGVSAVILDHAGNALEHGLPQDDRTFGLAKTTAKRGNPTTKECPECCAVLPLGTRTCPECGHEFPVGAAPRAQADSADGELVELEPVPVAKQCAAWDAYCASWERLNKWRLEHGKKPMKPGWVWHQFRERFGRKPPKGCKAPYELASEDEKHEALRKLHEERKIRGFKVGWVAYRFTERFGHGPHEIGATKCA